MPQAASLFGVYSASPRQHPMDPLRISGAWICVAGVLAVAHLLFAPAEAVLLTWIALWFSYGLAGPLFTHFVYNRRVRRWYRSGTQTGRASCRERVCRYVSSSVVPVTLKKKKKEQDTR